MKLQLLVSKWCPSCPTAEQVWSKVAAGNGLTLEVLDVGQPAGRHLALELGIRTVPAIVIDGTLRGVGTSSIADAFALVGDRQGKRS
ncbi:MAG TPA: thioredoxin family protein [Stellaceae bacterium]|nr:thioredoxin family protein [Stellaceae bacterium]